MPNGMPRLRVTILVAAACVALSACMTTPRTRELPPAAPPISAPGSAVAEIRLGSVFPLTGKEAIVGGAFREATEFLISEVNQRGGIRLGNAQLPVRLLLEDDRTEPGRSAGLVEELIRAHRVHAILGGYTSPIVQAHVPVIERYGIPYVTGGGASPSIYGRSKWVFGALSPVDFLARTQLEYLHDLIDAGRLPKPATITLLWEETDHGKDYRRGIQEYVRANPDYFRIVMDEGFPLFAPDFGPLLDRVKAAGADLFMADSHLEDYIAIHRQYTRLGLYHKMVTHGARGSETAARQALGVATDYIFSGVWTSPQLPYPQVRAFRDSYLAATNRNPEWFHMLAYDAARMLIAAIEQAGALEPERIRAALATVELKDSLMPGGVIKFSPTGQSVFPFVISQNKPGERLDVVWPKDAKTGESVAPMPPLN